MSNLLPLIEVIKQEQHLHEKILAAKLDERKYLSTGNANAILEITDDMVQWTQEAKRLESQRMEITESIASELGLNSARPTLHEIMEALPSYNRANLEQAGSLLKETVLQLQEQNRLNMQILKRSADTLNAELSAIVHEKETGVYNAKGFKKGTSTPPRIGLNVRG